MENLELIYGTGYKTELDVVIGCIGVITSIEAVLDVKGIAFVHTYLSQRLAEIDK